ncbi:conserved hypothetical protein [Vibrio phage 236O40-1]|nr:conserved hypothetical protein [Vibrio phage 236O40-1]
MSTGILGSPKKRGNLTAILSAVFNTAPRVGAAVSPDTNNHGTDQLAVKAFDSTSFSGFAVGNDVNKRGKTIGVIEAGNDIPVRGVTGKTYTPGAPIGVNAAGEVLPAADADTVFILNGSVCRASVAAIDETGAEVDHCLSINLMGGGSVKV